MVLESVVSQQLLPTLDHQSRVAAFEVMHANVAIKNLIREGKTFQIGSIIQTNKKSGLQTMDDSIFDLYVRGLVDKENAIGFAQDSVAMERKLSQEK